jgi:magnesium-protoporphyrin O-methyltransferase
MTENCQNGCCGSPSPDPRIAKHFDKRAADAARAGDFPEMVDVSRGLLFLLSDVASEQPTLLELGCGSGAMSVALLEAGATSVDGVDLSAQSIATAKRRAEVAGVAERAHFVVGDGSAVPLERHDWVVMDRVMCCFPDMERLLGNAVGAAARRVAFTVPQSRGAWGVFNRIFWGFEAKLTRIMPGTCPGYVHSMDLMARRLREAGFDLLRERKMGLWYAAVWQRA